MLCYDWPEPWPHGSRVCTVGWAAIERQSTSLTSHPCTCSWIGFICAKCLENAHNPLNMVNEPGKMSNLNTLHLRRYVDRWKKTECQTRRDISIPLQFWGFPSRKHGTSSVMVRFMKGVHDDISQTFSNFYQGMVRSCHGTMPGVMFFKHLFHFFSIVENPTNKHLWLTIATHFIEISVHSL